MSARNVGLALAVALALGAPAAFGQVPSPCDGEPAADARCLIGRGADLDAGSVIVRSGHQFRIETPVKRDLWLFDHGQVDRLPYGCGRRHAGALVNLNGVAHVCP